MTKHVDLLLYIQNSVVQINDSEQILIKTSL